MSCQQFRWFVDSILPAYEDNIKFCWLILWAGSIWCLCWERKSKGPLRKVNVVSQCCLEEEKKYFSRRPRDFLWILKKNIGPREVSWGCWRSLIMSKMDSSDFCSLTVKVLVPSHHPERNQLMIRKDAFYCHSVIPSWESEYGTRKRLFEEFRKIKSLGKIKRNQMESHQKHGCMACRMWDTMKRRADTYLHKYTPGAIHC